MEALIAEVDLTPKPGLVDRANNGSHRDMDIFTFTASAAALTPYWGRCFQTGRETAALTPEARELLELRDAVIYDAIYGQQYITAAMNRPSGHG